MTRTNIPSLFQAMFYGAHYAFKVPDNCSDSSTFALGFQEGISEVNHLKAVAAGELQIKREGVRCENREQFNVDPNEFDSGKGEGAKLFDLRKDLTQ